MAALRAELKSKFAFQNILSKNPHMHAVFELITNVANTNSTVLIEGETGTGKEQVARALHAAGKQRTGPFVAVNCATLPETLLESELFGHEKGSFTGALGQQRGHFRNGRWRHHLFGRDRRRARHHASQVAACPPRNALSNGSAVRIVSRSMSA